jgi:hypothetical protein
MNERLRQVEHCEDGVGAGGEDFARPSIDSAMVRSYFCDRAKVYSRGFMTIGVGRLVGSWLINSLEDICHDQGAFPSYFPPLDCMMVFVKRNSTPTLTWASSIPNAALSTMLLFCGTIAAGCASDEPNSETTTTPYPTSGGLGGGRIAPRFAVKLLTDEVSANGTLLVVIDGEADVPSNIGLRPQVYTEQSTGLDAEPLSQRSLREAYLTTLGFLELGSSFADRDLSSYAMFDFSSSCEEGCSMRFYYSEERVTDASDRSAFWEENPELWRSAELQFHWDDIAANTYQIRFDEETTEFENALGTLMVDVTDGQLTVTIEPVVQFMRDSSRPRYPIEPDAGDDGVFGSDADAGSR